MPVRTLSHWEQRWTRDRLRSRRPGRPLRRAGSECRLEIGETLDRLGPGVGLPVLRGLFPDVTRRELDALRRRRRRRDGRRNAVVLNVLRWTRPGAVWACDFCTPPNVIEGVYDRVFAVRDLASGFQLMWLPVVGESAETAIACLQALMREHGAPLVLKSDNGSAFVSEHFANMLCGNSVVHLLSPPVTPRYNGGIEAGNGSLKTRTHHIAAAAGRPGEWCVDDLEHARVLANATARPRGEKGPTPLEAWESRTAITDDERTAFASAVNRRRDEARRELDPSAPLNRNQQGSVDRKAVSRALVELGLLEMRRRVVPLPLHSRKWAKIS